MAECPAFPDPCPVDSTIRLATSNLRMNLPQEVLDEIFSHLPSNNKRSLRSCSLVSKSSLEPAYRLLFASISFEATAYQSWLNNISPTNTGLLRCARPLTYFVPRLAPTQPRSVYALWEYLP